MKNQKKNSIQANHAFDDPMLARQLFGEQNRNLHRIASSLAISLHSRGDQLLMEGETSQVQLARKVLDQLYGLLRKGYPVYPNDIDYAVQAIQANDKVNLKEIFLDTIYVTANKRCITPKNPNQKSYIEAIRNHDIVFGIGPAGTGKTYLAMAMAVAALSRGEVNRIILTRPAVEAGESLGFLPGDLAEKIDPYLRPLYDALHDMMKFEKAEGFIQQGVIEVAPLAFMRGRTLNDAFIILDEAQNTTTEQMKMFLTRIGFNSKTIVTGDVTQIDLPSKKKSGLLQAVDILQDIEGIAFTFFDQKDVVRHHIVRRIINAYEKLQAKENGMEELRPQLP
ncbi:phosphate starvation-inducible protein PhoH [Desulfobotulus alkaliphilus]|uniref:PhoH-like protein n=1 Tax=Desulfobotulus alkaliphilus TaxID=622671 RepID=A0A562RRL2_9BACT|nr:PhoH family protein [Desulfobotulus alkaliphilus]TWI71672.1 phosphate starvation-inducible protein PhoH [Desulfobotulus alkaliphilus]